MSVLRRRKARGGAVLVAALFGAPLVAVAMMATPERATAADSASPPARDATAPDLAIGIDDGHTSVRVGDRVTYTVTIRNLGTAAADDLLVTQTLPAGARVGSADHDGVIKAATVAWHTDLAGGRETRLVVQAVVTKTQPGQLRLASVVCATVDGDTRPIVCAADSDRLPASAGARDAAAGSHASRGPRGWLIALCVGVGAVLALVAGLVARRRWVSRPSTATGAKPEGLAASSPDTEDDLDEVQVPDLR